MKSVSLLCASVVVLGVSAPALAQTAPVEAIEVKKKVAVDIPADQNPWLTGVASFFIPGWGQGIAGDWGRAAIHVLVNVGLNLTRTALSSNATANSALTVASLGLSCYSAWDAVSLTNALADEHKALREAAEESALPRVDLTAGVALSSDHLSYR